MQILRNLNRKLKEIGFWGDKLSLPVYLVGGAVRDMLVGRKKLDWDIVTEGDPVKLVKLLSEKWNAKIISHRRFGTYVLILPDGRHIDFATARKETYPSPGALPEVSFSNLIEDLYRRDFTVNAIALPLNAENRGEIIDYYGGTKDLSIKRLRVLHGRSFIDDPTRILRLARFAGRGFKIEKKTERLALAGREYLRHISDERIREEILAILSEKNPLSALNFLEKWDIMSLILPAVKIKHDDRKLSRLKSIEDRLAHLFSNLSEKEFRKILNKLKLIRKLKTYLEKTRNPFATKPILIGRDLIKMGYTPGPVFNKILNALSTSNVKTRRQAVRFVFDKFPQKR